VVWFEGKPLIQPALHTAQPALIPGDSGKQNMLQISLTPMSAYSHSQVYWSHSQVYILIPRSTWSHSQVFSVSISGLLSPIPRSSQSHSQVYSVSFPGLLSLILRSTQSHSQVYWSHSQVYSIPSPISFTPRSTQSYLLPGLLV